MNFNFTNHTTTYTLGLAVKIYTRLWHLFFSECFVFNFFLDVGQHEIERQRTILQYFAHKSLPILIIYGISSPSFSKHSERFQTPTTCLILVSSINQCGHGRGRGLVKCPLLCTKSKIVHKGREGGRVKNLQKLFAWFMNDPFVYKQRLPIYIQFYNTHYNMPRTRVHE